jgi:ADP-ribose pyrophosphatase YjhB (NUDIX family)
MNLIFKFIGRIIKLYWRVMQPVTVGVRALVENEQDQILLVKHTYSSLWYLPGGGINKKEHLRDALARELKEEIGLEIIDEPMLLATYANFLEHKSDFVSLFIVKKFKITSIKNMEIEEWGFFDKDKIPENTSPATRRRLSEYDKQKTIDYKW